MKKITVFTPTYNRAYTLIMLYQSLLRQSNFDFEWLIIDDGSTDNTKELVENWQNNKNPFEIRYYKTENGGKPRAINKALELVQCPYIFIIDSDDYFTDEALAFLLERVKELEEDTELVGIGILRGFNESEAFGKANFSTNIFIDANNLEREKFGLNFECNELYKVEILKNYPFEVWEGETFSPEEIVLNEMALQGYKVRWYNKVGVISEYLEDGLTVNAFDLIKKNPMGYAMLFNHQLKYKTTFKEKFNAAYLMVCYSVIGKNLSYILRSNSLFVTLLSFPIGLLVARRRKKQFEHALCQKGKSKNKHFVKAPSRAL
jgi:glycosyltransferase involved in cell wall biosynthesis